MLMIVNNLNQLIEYYKTAEKVQKAYKEDKTIKEVIIEKG